ncbi:MAG: nicotinate-nucleotide adenylyltransferase [Eubacteriales bacterium]|nr:nicotinate-nucleotide adenylyltransferase [Eubacteriales bacterium]
MKMTKKIGIMGGTFNPIHFGHLLLAETAYEQFGLDEIMIMPTKNTYYKKMPHHVTQEQRLDMIRLAIEDNPHFHLSLEEINREGTTYTVETLQNLTKEHPDYEYYFIVGADSLYHMESWYQPEEIFKMAIIVVAGRGGASVSALESQIEYLENKFDDARIEKLYSPIMEISSSGIRKRIIQGESIRYLLPQNVVNYIEEHKVYLAEETEE